MRRALLGHLDGSECGCIRKRMLPSECAIDTKKGREEEGERERGREGRRRAEALQEMSAEMSADGTRGCERARLLK